MEGSILTHIATFILGLLFVQMWSNAFDPRKKPRARSETGKTRKAVTESVTNFKRAQNAKIVKEGSAIPPSMAEQAFIDGWALACRYYNDWSIDVIREYSVLNGKYRIDIFFPGYETGLEIDGKVGHATPEDISKDRRREREIEDKLGIKLRRYGAKEVLADPEGVASDVYVYLKGLR